jgi:hypothetical protein
MQKIISILSLSIGVLTLFFTVDPAETMGVNPLQGGCARQGTYIGGLPSELNHVFQCLHHSPCGTSSVPILLETKQISIYGDIKQWLVETTNTSNTFYSIQQQNTIFNNATVLANNNKPSSKILYNMQFFLDHTGQTGVYTISVGANITYARCSP